MTTITQIENALKAINQASFQNLINHLLHLQGNKFISAPGSVVGKEKTSKGTPDSSFKINVDKYIFVECTTQEKLGASKTFFNKLSKDIDHCFKEELTGVHKENIEKVILACNEKISVNEHKKLNDKIKSINVDTEFEIFNIQNLPLLLYDYPKLLEEYLNIQILKGQIYTIDQFLSKTEKGLQPSLTNEFIAREEELNSCNDALKKYDILLLSGGAGVGKSKLAIKILEGFSKDDYIPIVIQSSGVSLWDDYQHLFSIGKKHIILFDDANNAITNLKYLLNKLEDSKSYSVKLIITSRDYVKKNIITCLENYPFTEINITEFKDEEIQKIIESKLPNLRNHNDITRKIIDLAKGNARISLMATNSVTPNAETNYLNNPVLLYEKYFRKISKEIGIFDDHTILKSLAIVSFFGIVDRSNEELKNLLSSKFGIDWNELWTAILKLHNNEIIDIYSNEIVKISDQVLATYAFYKCFIDESSTIINYADWIAAFIEKFPDRIRATLIDVNNTFTYNHVKNIVLPHLNKVTSQLHTDEEIYSFYNLFWFYKGRNCLLYVKKWIKSLSYEVQPETFNFSYDNNAHTRATKHFELLKNFWNHPNELLRPSIELTLELVNKQPSRLSEVLNYIHDDFKYKLNDRDAGYKRQNILFDVLFDENLCEPKKSFANVIFLKLSEALLGWHYTEFASAKGNAFTIYNFDLYKSDKLLHLRNRMLNQIYYLFDFENDQIRKILHKIIHPGGKIDKSIYVEELPIYKKIICSRLDKNQYEHCNFVSVLAKFISEGGGEYPEKWNLFLESDITKLHLFLNPSWEFKKGQSHREFIDEKRKEFDKFVKSNNWKNLEKFLLNADALYGQQKDKQGWYIESALTDIYISIARKNKSEFKKALKLFFSGKVLFTLQVTIISIALQESILTGKEILDLMNKFEFKGRPYWESVLLTNLPEEQINDDFLESLLDNFKNSKDYVYIYRMLDYLKYENTFCNYKEKNPELADHNIITYLSSIILNKTRITNRDFGFNFCEECAPYFGNHIHVLKKAFWSQYEIDSHFDFEGKELKAIMDIDNNFINESIKNNIIGLGYYSKIRLENISADIIWEYTEYDNLIEDILLTIIEKDKYALSNEDDIDSLFISKNNDSNISEKAKELIFKLTEKHSNNEQLLLMLVEIVYRNFKGWFLEYFKRFLMINKDIKTIKKISFDRSSSTTGSWVPVFQKKIEFYHNIIDMISALPDLLDYSEHLDYFEQKIIWKKDEIAREQRRDFITEFY